MNDLQMRAALEKKYSKDFVKKLTTSQVQAIYLRLKSQGKI